MVARPVPRMSRSSISPRRQGQSPRRPQQHSPPPPYVRSSHQQTQHEYPDPVSSNQTGLSAHCYPGPTRSAGHYPHSTSPAFDPTYPSQSIHHQDQHLVHSYTHPYPGDIREGNQPSYLPQREEDPYPTYHGHEDTHDHDNHHEYHDHHDHQAHPYEQYHAHQIDQVEQGQSEFEMSSQAEQRAATADLQSSSTGPSQTAAGPVVNTTAQAVQAPPPGTVSNGDGSRPIRRTKASRACDNCRRRKVKCDGTNETGTPPCTKCEKANETCQYQRMPLKRGPTKGYISALAGRVTALESKIEGNTPQATDPEANGSVMRGTKRAHSAMSTEDDDLSGQHQAIQHRRRSHPSAIPLGWIDQDVDIYYDLIHPTFSLLHDDKKILTESLTDASEDIQMYFTKTLHQLVAIMSTTVLNVHDHQHLSTNVKAMISDKEVCRRPFDKLVMVQIMIFLFFSEEMMAFKVSGVNVWLGKAIQLAQAEKFNDRGNRLHKWTTKVWLSLVVIDQIHASRHNVEKQIVLKGKVLHGSDRKMLGEGGFALVQIILTLNDVLALLSNKPRATTEEKNNHQIVYITLRGQIDRMEEFAESIHLSSPAIDLMQAHVNLFHKFVGPSKLSEVIEGASAIVEKLIAHGVKSPVTHETATFVTVVLTKALDLVHGHSATITQLHRLRGWFESGVAGSAAWATPLKNCIAKKLEGVQTQVNDENTLQTQVNDENTLHNLANAAVGDLSEADSVEEIEDVDWEPCTSGYAELTG